MFLKHSFFKGCLNFKQPFLFTLVSCFILFISISCSDKQDPENEIITTVEGEPINIEVFEAKYVRHLIQTGRNDTPKERYAYLNQFQDEILLANKAAESGFLEHPTYQRTISFEQRKAMVDFYFLDEMEKRLEPATDDEVRLAYAKSKRTAYVRHLYSQNRDEIEGYYDRLLEGEDFIDLANELYETSSYDSLAGYIGPVKYYAVDDAFAEAAYSTNQGEFSKPVRSNFGYHIVYVEYLEVPVILTEDDYKFRRPGIASQVRLRNQELEANEYVRNLMESLLVQVSEENVLQLKSVIDGLSENNIVNNSNQSENQSSDIWKDSDFRQLQSSMNGETVLASYIFQGERRDFTFNDYLKWLPYLSYAESKARTAASVGKGLRNEVFYMLADESGYQNDERVQKEVRFKGYEVLSELYQRDLTRQVLQDTSEVEIPEEVKIRLIGNRTFVMDANYWQFSISGVNEGLKLKEQLEKGKLKPQQRSTYEELSVSELPNSDPKFSLLGKALVGTPVIAFSELEGWLILNVLDRDIIETTNGQVNSQMQRRYKVYKYLSDEVESLRESTEIQIDTALFNRMYDLNKKKENS